MDVCSVWLVALAVLPWLKSASSLITEMVIYKGSNISLFDLELLDGITCGTYGTDSYRGPDLNLERKPNCPYEVWICFGACTPSNFFIRLTVNDPTQYLGDWMQDQPMSPTGFFFSREGGFDFMLNSTSTETKAAVYNPDADVEKPRFFALPHGTDPKLFSTSTFSEADFLVVRYVYDDNDCVKPEDPPIHYKTCTEALLTGQNMLTSMTQPITTDSAWAVNQLQSETSTTPTSWTDGTYSTAKPRGIATVQPVTNVTAGDSNSSSEQSVNTAEDLLTTASTNSQNTDAKESFTTATLESQTLDSITTMGTKSEDITNTAQSTPTASTRNRTDLCSCSCEYYARVMYWRNMTAQNVTIEQQLILLGPIMEATKKELTVNKSDLSSFRNTKISAPDDRSSSKGIGVISAIFLCLAIGSLVACDLMSCGKHLSYAKQTCCRK